MNNKKIDTPVQSPRFHYGAKATFLAPASLRATSDPLPEATAGGKDQILTVASSDTLANCAGPTGFHATALTVPAP